MPTKADFSEDEWQAMQKGITGAGMLVSVTDRDFTDSFGEASAMQVLADSVRRARASDEGPRDAKRRDSAHRLAAGGRDGDDRRASPSVAT